MASSADAVSRAVGGAHRPDAASPRAKPFAPGHSLPDIVLLEKGQTTEWVTATFAAAQFLRVPRPLVSLEAVDPDGTRHPLLRRHAVSGESPSDFARAVKVIRYMAGIKPRLYVVQVSDSSGDPPRPLAVFTAILPL